MGVIMSNISALINLRNPAPVVSEAGGARISVIPGSRVYWPREYPGDWMTMAIIADNKPARAKLEKGKKYWFCTCGKSKNQPFCDGSHKGSEFTPLEFVCEESKDYFLCCCKQSASKPYCDGSHKQFSQGQVGTEAP